MVFLRAFMHCSGAYMLPLQLVIAEHKRNRVEKLKIRGSYRRVAKGEIIVVGTPCGNFFDSIAHCNVIC